MNLTAVLMALADGPPINFASSAATVQEVTGVVKPAGLEAGDLALVWAMDVSTSSALQTGGVTNWARIDQTAGATIWNNHTLFWKVMTSADLADTWDLTVATQRGCMAVRYVAHGATAVTKKSGVNNAGNATSLTLSGFTRAAGHYGTISVMGLSAISGSPVPPSDFVSRIAGATGAIADALSNYVDGQAAVWTWTGSVRAAGMLLEVTGP